MVTITKSDMSAFEAFKAAAAEFAKAHPQEALAMDMTTTTAQNVSNKPTLDTLLDDAKTFGAASAKAKDALVQFGLRALNGAYHGAIDTTANKYGQDIDDAHKLNEAYFKGRNGAVVFDPKAQNQRTATSKLRAVIKAGGLTKFGGGEPLTTVNNLMNIYTKLRADHTNSKLLQDAYGVLVLACRTLVRRDQVPGEAELRQMCYKPQHQPATVEHLIEAMRKTVAAIENGKKGDEALKNAYTQAIKEACTAILTDIAAKRGGVAPSMAPAAQNKRQRKSKPAAVSPDAQAA